MSERDSGRRWQRGCRRPRGPRPGGTCRPLGGGGGDARGSLEIRWEACRGRVLLVEGTSGGATTAPLLQSLDRAWALPAPGEGAALGETGPRQPSPSPSARSGPVASASPGPGRHEATVPVRGHVLRGRVGEGARERAGCRGFPSPPPDCRALTPHPRPRKDKCKGWLGRGTFGEAVLRTDGGYWRI